MKQYIPTWVKFKFKLGRYLHRERVQIPIIFSDSRWSMNSKLSCGMNRRLFVYNIIVYINYLEVRIGAYQRFSI